MHKKSCIKDYTVVPFPTHQAGTTPILLCAITLSFIFYPGLMLFAESTSFFRRSMWSLARMKKTRHAFPEKMYTRKTYFYFFPCVDLLSLSCMLAWIKWVKSVLKSYAVLSCVISVKRHFSFLPSTHSSSETDGPTNRDNIYRQKYMSTLTCNEMTSPHSYSGTLFMSTGNLKKGVWWILASIFCTF